jgi:hypothetical protein
VYYVNVFFSQMLLMSRVYIVIRLFIRAVEIIFTLPKNRRLRNKMAQSSSYSEWYTHASDLDNSQKKEKWLGRTDDGTSTHYNWAVIKQLMKNMKVARSKEDSIMALVVLQQCIRRNVGGVMSADLFSYSNTGQPKYLVTEFVEEVVKTIRWVTEEAAKLPAEGENGSDADADQKSIVLQKKINQTRRKTLMAGLQTRRKTLLVGLGEDLNNDSDEISAGKSTLSTEEVLVFLKRARAAYGRTALCLSGGAMMGLYHFGHVLGLLEAGMLPHIISGTSAGAIIGAVVCTRTDEELRRDLQADILSKQLTCFNRPWSERIRSFFWTGSMFDFDEWMELIQW